MSTGSRYEQSTYSFSGKSWTGTDDPVNRTADNTYLMSLSRGSRLEGRSMYYGSESSFLPSYLNVLTGPSIDNLKLQVLADIAEKIKGHGFDLGNSIAEGRETVQSAVGALSAMARAAKAIRHGNLDRALTALGQVPSGSNRRKLSTTSPGDTWLSMQYGWLPLLSDVHEVATKWEAITSPPRTLNYKRRKRRRVKSTAYDGHYKVLYDNIASVEGRVRISESLSVPRALGLIDPVGVAWELVPYSFVVDWFLPISTYLDTLNVFRGTDATIAWTYYRQDTSTIIGIAPGFEERLGFGITVCPKAQCNNISVVRTAREGVTVPLPAVRSIPDAMSPLRIANAAALLSGQLARLFR